MVSDHFDTENDSIKVNNSSSADLYLPESFVYFPLWGTYTPAAASWGEWMVCGWSSTAAMAQNLSISTTAQTGWSQPHYVPRLKYDHLGCNVQKFPLLSRKVLFFHYQPWLKKQAKESETSQRDWFQSKQNYQRSVASRAGGIWRELGHFAQTVEVRDMASGDISKTCHWFFTLQHISCVSVTEPGHVSGYATHTQTRYTHTPSRGLFDIQYLVSVHTQPMSH